MCMFMIQCNLNVHVVLYSLSLLQVVYSYQGYIVGEFTGGGGSIVEAR